jgi:16S rRNA (cytosine967-C5)-methyltransferase
LLSDIVELASFRFTLSAGIETQQWLGSMLQQPRLFIRIRKRREEIVRLLQQNELPFEELNDNCLSMPNGAPVDKLLPSDAYVVQDHSSQQTGTYFSPKTGESWWDCCSGAGGKSLLLKDMEPAVQLTVSDKRSSILHNLRERFKLYKHALPVSVVADVAEPGEIEKHLAGKLFDNIICDVPCTGSGTWARTPEQLYFFKEEYVREFSERQRQIATNVSSYLKPGGRLIYITCSIFREENEEIIDYFLSRNNITLESQQLINGIEAKADSMFVSVLRKQY